MIFDATTNGPRWTIALGLAILALGLWFARRWRAEDRRARERESRRREMARQAEARTRYFDHALANGHTVTEALEFSADPWSWL